MSYRSLHNTKHTSFIKPMYFYKQTCEGFPLGFFCLPKMSQKRFVLTDFCKSPSINGPRRANFCGGPGLENLAPMHTSRYGYGINDSLQSVLLNGQPRSRLCSHVKQMGFF